MEMSTRCQLEEALRRNRAHRSVGAVRPFTSCAAVSSTVSLSQPLVFDFTCLRREEVL